MAAAGVGSGAYMGEDLAAEVSLAGPGIGATGAVGTVAKDPLTTDLTPARAFTGRAVELQAALPDLFRRPGSLEALRPRDDQVNFAREMGQPGYLEIFPRAGTKQPRLLQKLEQMLGDKLRAAERLVQGPAHGSQRTHVGAANLRLDAHRQVFEAFIQAFTTYKPLLSAIKREYDSVLDDSLKSAHENVVMRAELAVAEQRKNRAVEEARAEAAASAASLRAELHARLMEAEERSRKAEAREAKLESEVKRLQSSLAKLQEDLEGAKRANQSLTAQMVAESSWAAKPLAGQIAAVVVGKKSEPEQKGDKAQ